jgi:hypothetical protein
MFVHSRPCRNRIRLLRGNVSRKILSQEYMHYHLNIRPVVILAIRPGEAGY